VAPSILVAIGPRRGLALAWRATAVGLVSVCIYKFLKSRFNRPRPYENQGLEPLHAPPDRFSFPSGHAMNNIAVALYIGHFLPPALSILLPFAVLVSFSRVYLRVHYPSDVLVGATLGLLIGEIAPHVPHFTSISKLF
jgi:undecaprenyl-diphosphatase